MSDKQGAEHYPDTVMSPVDITVDSVTTTIETIKEELSDVFVR
jgi:hypothetical protein